MKLHGGPSLKMDDIVVFVSYIFFIVVFFYFVRYETVATACLSILHFPQIGWTLNYFKGRLNVE